MMATVTDFQAKIIEALGWNGNMTALALAADLGQPLAVVRSAIANLVLAGAIESDEQGRFYLCR